MTEHLNNPFGFEDKADFKTLIKNGATILDVRTVEEYVQGHVENSINIPLDELPFSLSKLQKETPIVAVCESGIRSRSAVDFLKSNGYSDSYNAGSWYNLI